MAIFLEKSTLSKKLYNKFKYGEVSRFLTSQLHRIGIVFIPFYVFQQGKFLHECPVPKNGLDGYEVGFLDKKHMNYISSLMDRSESELMSWLEKGIKCFGVKYYDTLAAFIWCNFDVCDYPNYTFSLKDDEIYLCYLYTIETFRGQNIACYLRYKLYETLETLGYNKFLSIVPYFNTPAIKAIGKLEARPLILALHFEILRKWRGCWLLRDYGYPVMKDILQRRLT